MLLMERLESRFMMKTQSMFIEKIMYILFFLYKNIVGEIYQNVKG